MFETNSRNHLFFLLSNILDLIDGLSREVQRNSLDANGEDTLTNLLFGPQRGSRGLHLANNSLELYQRLCDLEKSTHKRVSVDNIVAEDTVADDGQTDRPVDVDVIGSVAKKAKADRTPDADDNVDADADAVVEERATKRAKRQPKKVRISAENLPKVLRDAKKRASMKARRSSHGPHRKSTQKGAVPQQRTRRGRRSSKVRISVTASPQTSVVLKKRKTSIGPKSKPIEPSKSKADPKPFKCAVFGCDYAGARPGHLKTHMKRHDKEKLIDCKKCDMKFKSSDGIPYAKHSADHK